MLRLRSNKVFSLAFHRFEFKGDFFMEQVRVFFKKIGIIRYISHLDLQRAMSRALLRSGLDIVFSEGFNPHTKIAFALPLSIFWESEYEIFDFRLNKDTPSDEVRKKLLGVMPRGIEIFAVAEPKEKISSCCTARYRLTFTTDKSADEIKEVLSGDITVLKKTKSKEYLCDISPFITDRVIYESEGRVILEATLTAGSADYLNPNYIAAFLDSRIDDCLIRRLCLYDGDCRPLE